MRNYYAVWWCVLSSPWLCQMNWKAFSLTLFYDAVTTALLGCLFYSRGLTTCGRWTPPEKEIQPMFFFVIKHDLLQTVCATKIKREVLLPWVSSVIWWGFYSDLSSTVDVWPIVLASVSKCFWQASEKTVRKGKLPDFSPPIKLCPGQ